MKIRFSVGIALIVILAVLGWVALRSAKRDPADAAASSEMRPNAGAEQGASLPMGHDASEPSKSVSTGNPTAQPHASGNVPVARTPQSSSGAQAPGVVASTPPASSPVMVPTTSGTSTGGPAAGEVNVELIAADLDKLSLSMRDYRTLMSQNPVGTNEEITAALNGGNPKGSRLAPDDSNVNGEGKMVDRWGTPYFFHQMSATSMEIHSAGPDKKMGTEDDIIQR